MKNIIFSLFLSLMVIQANAQGRDFSKIEINATQVSGLVYMLTGAGGNMGVLVGNDGVFLIDDQFAPLTTKIRAAIRKINKGPIRFVFNTHWHRDHTGGNENLGMSGSVIVAHKNVRKRLSTTQFSKFWNSKHEPKPKGALPIITFTNEMSFHLNNDDIQVLHMAHAHTDGDGVLYFKNSNVIHTGDIFFNGIYPYIDVDAGGSIDGLIAAVERILKLSKSNTKIIPGHGSLAKKKDLEAYLKMLKTIRSSVFSLIKGGKSVDEAISAKPSSEFDKNWGGGFMSPDKFVRIVYTSLKSG